MPSFSRGTPFAIIVALALLGALPQPLSASYEAQIQSEARLLAGKIAEHGKTAVAVIDFTDLDGTVTHLGRLMAEELSVALAGSARSFKVVDRGHIRRLLQENQLAADGLIDPENARELGKVAGVDALITASITPFGDSVRLSIKVLDSESAQVLASSSCSIAKTHAIDDLLRQDVASSGRAGSSKSSNSSGASSTVVTEGQLKFTLQECQRQSGTVTCRLTLLNSGQDTKIYFRTASTRVLDPSGNEYYARKIQLGSDSTSYYTNRTLVRDIPIKASADFDGLGYQLRTLALVEFDFSKFTIQFKDVPIS